MNLWRKAAGYFVRRLSLTDPKKNPEEVGARSHAGENVSDHSALSLSAVWACTNLLTGTQASLPLMVYRVDREGSRKVAKNHPLYRVLHDSPNADQTALDFWEFMTASLELWGNAYARVLKVDGRIVGLDPVLPDIVTVKRLGNGDIEYSWSFDGRYWKLTQADVFHIRGFGGNPLGGMSTLHFARHSLGLATAIDKAAAGMFGNGMRPSGVLTFEKFLTPEQREVAEKKLVEKFVGAMNAGRPMVLEGGTTWQQLTINPEDAQMLESRAFSIEEICRFFGVPPFMVGHTEKSTSWGTGLEQQTLGFQKFTLRRRLKRIEQAIEKQLLSPQDRANGVSVEFNLEGLLRADSAGRSAFYREMTQIGAMTINEVRELENLPPVDGGDVPRMQSQNVPINAPAAAIEPPRLALPAPERTV